MRYHLHPPDWQKLQSLTVLLVGEVGTGGHWLQGWEPCWHHHLGDNFDIIQLIPWPWSSISFWPCILDRYLPRSLVDETGTCSITAWLVTSRETRGLWAQEQRYGDWGTFTRNTARGWQWLSTAWSNLHPQLLTIVAELRRVIILTMKETQGKVTFLRYCWGNFAKCILAVI